MHIPRLIISGLSGGAGKSMLSLGLARAFARRGSAVLACKKGPDYIDAAWLALAAGSGQCNLDPFFSPGPALAAIFALAARGHDLALIEGNRGLFDGLDLEGSCSTAQVARTLSAPVLLIVDCTKMTRTAAALVRGCLDFEPGLRIGGVVLNRTGNRRHRDLASLAVRELAGVPVLGVLPRQAEPFILERHMGLAGTDEVLYGAGAGQVLEKLADFIEEHCDLAAICALAGSALPLILPDDESGIGNRADSASPDSSAPVPAARSGGIQYAESVSTGSGPSSSGQAVRIGYVYDAALWFYYRENLEALEAAGAVLQPLSLLAPDPWPAIDGLYLGGGLPERHAASLCANRPVLDNLAALCRSGLPVYAECGGFMVLCRELLIGGESYPMAGLFDCAVEFCQRPQGLGYVEAEAALPNPYHPPGTTFRGHEFHFSRFRALDPPGASGAPTPDSMVLRLSRGSGMGRDERGACRDGLLLGNSFASYTHIYAPCVPHWAPAFADLCRKGSGGLEIAP